MMYTVDCPTRRRTMMKLRHGTNSLRQWLRVMSMGRRSETPNGYVLPVTLSRITRPGGVNTERSGQCHRHVPLTSIAIDHSDDGNALAARHGETETRTSLADHLRWESWL
jgi:hypothetical protein